MHCSWPLDSTGRSQSVVPAPGPGPCYPACWSSRKRLIQPVGLRASGSSSLLVFAQAAHPACWSSRKRLIQPVGLRASGSSPTQFVKPLVVDAEMMRDLVDHRDRDFVDDLILVFADLE